MIEKEFVPYQEALQLKELGFDEPCFAFFQVEYTELLPTMVDDDEEYRLTGYRTCSNLEMPKHYTSAPTFSQAFRWFRENHDLVHEISWSKYKGGLNFDYDVFSLVLPTDDELGDEDDIASDKSMETYNSLVDKGFKHKESDTYEEAELACLIKLIEMIKEKNK